MQVVFQHSHPHRCDVALVPWVVPFALVWLSLFVYPGLDPRMSYGFPIHACSYKLLFSVPLCEWPPYCPSDPGFGWGIVHVLNDMGEFRKKSSWTGADHRSVSMFSPLIPSSDQYYSWSADQVSVFIPHTNGFIWSVSQVTNLSTFPCSAAADDSVCCCCCLFLNKTLYFSGTCHDWISGLL